MEMGYRADLVKVDRVDHTITEGVLLEGSTIETDRAEEDMEGEGGGTVDLTIVLGIQVMETEEVMGMEAHPIVDTVERGTMGMVTAVHHHPETTIDPDLEAGARPDLNDDHHH